MGGGFLLAARREPGKGFDVLQGLTTMTMWKPILSGQVSWQAPRAGTTSLLLVACVWMILAAGAGLAATQTRCDFCNQTITGAYVVYQFEGKELTVCSRCDQTAPRCTLCKRPVAKDGRQLGGRFVCPDCAPKAHVCGICNTLILGPYVVFSVDRGELAVCKNCEQTSRRCASCDRPLRPREAVASGARLLCPSCHDQLPSCESCGESIIGTRYSISFRPGDFCEKCWKDRPPCSMCGAPTGKRRVELSDGRLLCLHCGQDAVTDINKVAGILAVVQPFLEKQFGSKLQTKVRLRLVGPEEIDAHPPDWNPAKTITSPKPAESVSLTERINDLERREANEKEFYPPKSTPSTDGGKRPVSREELRGAGSRELGKFVRRGKDFEIRILSGQPEGWCWETVAHEFAHAWQSEKNPDLTDPVWIEGFAQWAAELVLHWRGETAVLERLRLRDDFYGQAYRAVSHVETMRGKDAVLRAVLTMKGEE